MYIRRVSNFRVIFNSSRVKLFRVRSQASYGFYASFLQLCLGIYSYALCFLSYALPFRVMDHTFRVMLTSTRVKCSANWVILGSIMYFYRRVRLAQFQLGLFWTSKVQLRYFGFIISYCVFQNSNLIHDEQTPANKYHHSIILGQVTHLIEIGIFWTKKALKTNE